MFKRILFSFFIGGLITLYVIQDDPWVQQLVGNFFQQAVEHGLDCSLTYKVKRVNFFYPTIELEDVTMIPNNPDDGWILHAKTYTTRFTWHYLLGYGSIDMHLRFDECDVHSRMKKGKPAILSFIEKIINAPSAQIHTFLKEIVLHHARLQLVDEERDAVFTVRCDSESKKIESLLYSSVILHNGTLKVAQRTIFNNLSGSATAKTQGTSRGLDAEIKVDGSVILPHLSVADQCCFLRAAWLHDHGMIQLKSADDALIVDPLMLKMVNNALIATGNIEFPLSYITKLLSFGIELPITGRCRTRILARLDTQMPELHGNCKINSMRYGSYELPLEIKGSFSALQQHWRGSLYGSLGSGLSVNGMWQWDQADKKGSLELSNNATLELPDISYWRIMPQDFQLHMTLDDASAIGSYQAFAIHNKLDTTQLVAGTLTRTLDQIAIAGCNTTHSYKLSADLFPYLYLKQFVYSNANDTALVQLNSSAENPCHVTGDIDITLVRNLLKNWLNYSLQGEGKVAFSAGYAHQHITGSFMLDEGTIRLPETYNFIDTAQLKFDLDVVHKKLICDHFRIGMHKGMILSKHAVLHFNEHIIPSYIYVPLVFEQCLLNVKKDLFGIVSGHLLFEKKEQDLPRLFARLSLDKAQLKANLFSDIFQQDVRTYSRSVFPLPTTNADLDISLTTKEPIRIKTALLEGNAKVNLHIGNRLLTPEIRGTVLLSHGSLLFPYKPLHVHKAILTFVPNHPYEPIIDLVAKNSIKRHAVTLRVSGLTSDPHMYLTATPALTEEQIISLLFVGTQEESLNVVVPALVMQNLKSMLFDAKQSPLRLDRYAKNMFRPFQYIHLVPSFSDQTGRGGLRGTVEIEVSERWRALIQQNFSLSEDTRFELEYLLTDDITLRAIRDERRDVSIEAELRWKF